MSLDEPALIDCCTQASPQPVDDEGSHLCVAQPEEHCADSQVS